MSTHQNISWKAALSKIQSVFFAWDANINMSWFNLNEGLSSIKGQISSFASGVEGLVTNHLNPGKLDLIEHVYKTTVDFDSSIVIKSNLTCIIIVYLNITSHRSSLLGIGSVVFLIEFTYKLCVSSLSTSYVCVFCWFIWVYKYNTVYMYLLVALDRAYP